MSMDLIGTLWARPAYESGVYALARTRAAGPILEVPLLRLVECEALHINIWLTSRHGLGPKGERGAPQGLRCRNYSTA